MKWAYCHPSPTTNEQQMSHTIYFVHVCNIIKYIYTRCTQWNLTFPVMYAGKGL